MCMYISRRMRQFSLRELRSRSAPIVKGKVNSFQTTPTPDPEQLYKYCSVIKQEEAMF